MVGVRGGGFITFYILIHTKTVPKLVIKLKNMTKIRFSISNGKLFFVKKI